MYYDKQIRYIDYLENGEKQRNCGYVKITVTDHRLQGISDVRCDSGTFVSYVEAFQIWIYTITG